MMTRAITTALLHAEITSVMTLAPPEVPSPPGVMSPSTPPGGDNPQIEDDGPLGQRDPSTGVDAREEEGIPPGVHYSAAS